MNINTFKKGDIVTRNVPMKLHFGMDESYCGDRLELVAYSEIAKLIQFRSKTMDLFTISFAVNEWDEGWCLYPEHFETKL